MKNKSAIIKILALGLLVLAIAFILINSLESGVASDRRSLALLDLLNVVLNGLGIKSLSNIVIRKIAHFTEFFALGLISCVAIRLFVTKRKRFYVLISLGIGLIVAIADELVQFTSAGRTPRITDVLIDFSGVVSAVLIFYGIFAVVKAIKRRKTNER